MLLALLLLSLAAVSSFRSGLRVPLRSLPRELAMQKEFSFKDMRKTTEDKMKKSLDALQLQFSSLRAGGANPTMLDRVNVDYFGSMTPLNQVARVSAQGSQQLVVEPFDKSLLKEIEKAIITADLNLNPTNDGSGVIRIMVPPLTEDRRKELVKQAKTISEESKVALRNIRRDAVDAIKKAEKDSGLSKDASKEYQEGIQKVTDDFVKKVEAMAKQKEKDLLTL